MLPRWYTEALDRACTAALTGKIKVTVLKPDGHVKIEIDEYGFVVVTLVSDEGKMMYDDWHKACSQRSVSGAPNGGIHHHVLIFRPRP